MKAIRYPKGWARIWFMDEESVIWKSLSAGFQSSNFSAITPMYLRNLDVGSGMMTEMITGSESWNSE